ncbi:hypothetical protein ACFQGU_15550, partial [Longivirga aurantiaca]
ESVLGRLISATSERDAVEILERLGWASGTVVVPVVIRCDPELALTSQRSLDSVTQTVESVFTGTRGRAIPATAGVVGALLTAPAGHVDPAALASELRHDIAGALRDRGQAAGAAIGVGRPATSGLEVAQEFRSAAWAATWAALSEDGVRIAPGGDQRTTRQLFTLEVGLAPAVAEQIDRIGRVQSHDMRHGTDLLETLAVFVR